jgi:hypothetical protein
MYSTIEAPRWLKPLIGNEQLLQTERQVRSSAKRQLFQALVLGRAPE